jgi:transcriptional regulator with XRE-family HTH domain
VHVTPNGAAIKAFRQLRGISLRQLAELTQSSPSHMSRIEHEQRGASDVLLPDIAAVLDVPLAAITREKL